MKMTRDHTGTVKIDGKFVAKIPESESFLSIFDTAMFVEGGDYTIDPDWVYVDGVKARKQLRKCFGQEAYCESVLVWHPNVDDIGTLESRYFRVENAKQKFIKERLNPCFDDVVRVGKAHCKVTHKYKGDSAPWWQYEGDEYGISFNWIDEPTTPENLEIGQRYYEMDNYSKTIRQRARKFKTALQSRLIEKVDEITGTSKGCYQKDEGKEGDQIKFVINGRNYWYHTVINHRGVIYWDILSWTTDNVKVVEIQ